MKDRRLGIDRREFSYTLYIPERRFVKDRRNEFDRRRGLELRSLNRLTDDRRKRFMV